MTCEGCISTVEAGGKIYTDGPQSQQSRSLDLSPGEANIGLEHTKTRYLVSNGLCEGSPCEESAPCEFELTLTIKDEFAVSIATMKPVTVDGKGPDFVFCDGGCFSDFKIPFERSCGPGQNTFTYDKTFDVRTTVGSTEVVCMPISEEFDFGCNACTDD
tara:strand:- start:1829 stop:2305 length:477 start_codon:yes stop_codon:yes gene_type:complete